MDYSKGIIEQGNFQIIKEIYFLDHKKQQAQVQVTISYLRELLNIHSKLEFLIKIIKIIMVRIGAEKKKKFLKS